MHPIAIMYFTYMSFSLIILLRRGCKLVGSAPAESLATLGWRRAGVFGTYCWSIES